MISIEREKKKKKQQKTDIFFKQKQKTERKQLKIGKVLINGGKFLT